MPEVQEHERSGNCGNDLEVVAYRKKDLVGQEEDHQGEQDRKPQNHPEKTGDQFQGRAISTPGHIYRSICHNGSSLVILKKRL